MKFLPKAIEWISVWSVSSESYQEVLVATHKHSVEDWYIRFGSIQPFDDYKEFKVMVNGKEIDKSEILSIGLFQHYGYLKETKR